jgi:arylsulfatase
MLPRKEEHTMRWLAQLSLAGIALLALLAAERAAAQEKRPNVVFILADNVGYGDLGPYGGGELRGAPTPRIDQLAREGLRLTQYLVEPGCTPSRAALMTGQYSIRHGLSLVIVPGSSSTLSKDAVTMGELFKGAGYATAIFGKWHLGAEPQSLPTAHRFDEFYGIPPDISWDSATYVDTIELTHSILAPPGVLLAKGPHIVEAVAGGSLRSIKPYTRDVRAEIDTELVAKSIDFMKRQQVVGKPFFLYLPFSMGHFPNLPSAQFKGKSRIGQYGDKLMEDDHHVGQILDTLKELGVNDNTLVVFASDNGPPGQTAREMGNQGTPDMGNSGPFRGELGEATEGSIRTFCFIRWPGRVKPGTSSYAMFSAMDFFPTFARLIGSKMTTDRPIDGVDQTDVLLGKSETGDRDSLLTFIGSDLVTVRWKQWRMYFTDVHPTGIGHSANPACSRPARPWLGIQRSTTSKWTRTRSWWSARCSAGRPDRCSRWSRNTRKRSRSIRTRRRPTSRSSETRRRPEDYMTTRSSSSRRRAAESGMDRSSRRTCRRPRCAGDARAARRGSRDRRRRDR